MAITIEFEDRGQDFLAWTIDENGVVIECKPFQAWLWKGRQLVDHANLKRGDVVHFLDNDNHMRPMKYRVARVTR